MNIFKQVFDGMTHQIIIRLPKINRMITLDIIWSLTSVLTSDAPLSPVHSPNESSKLPAAGTIKSNRKFMYARIA